MKIEKQITVKVALYMDNGESSTVYFDVNNDCENEETFADAEICRQQLELAVEIVESITNLSRKSNSVYEVFEILEENNVLKEVSKYREELEWITQARQFYAEGKRVAGVKACRDGTGWGLKEALDYCDANFRRPTV